MKNILFILSLIVGTVTFAQPSWQWAEAINSSQDEKTLDIATVLASGETYACGYFDGNLSAIFTLGLNGTPNMNAPIGVRDGFVAKYNAIGNVVWAFKIGGAGATVEIEAITDAPNGNIYVTGEFFNGSVDFQGVVSSISSIRTPTGASKNMFLAAYSSNGELLWVTSSTDTGNSIGFGITADVNGIYVAGRFAGDITFPPLAPITWTGIASYFDAYVTKFDFSGNATDIKTIFSTTGDGHVKAFSLITDGTGEIYVVGTSGSSGWTYGPVGFNPTDNNNGIAGTDDIWVIKIHESNFNMHWSQVIGSVEGDIAKGIAYDGTDIYLTGGVGGASINFPGIGAVASIGTAMDIFTCKLFDASGLTDWVFLEQNNSAIDTYGSDIVIDAAGDLYITGTHTDTTGFNGGLNSIPTIGGLDVFVMSRKNTGAFNWAVSAGGLGNDEGFGIGIDNVGSIYTGGSYDLLSAFGAINLVTDAQNNGFVAKLNLCSLSIVCPANQTVTANASCQYTLLDYTVMATPFASCGIASVTQLPIAGTVVNSGINPVTVYLTDNSGNVDSCSFDVIVESAVNPTVVSCGDVLIGETTVGSGNNGGMFTCTGTPTPGEDVYYQVTVPTGNYLLGITLSNVIDASDTTVNVFWVGGSCPLGSGCLSSDNYNIVDQDFDSNGQNQLVFSAVGPGTYYFVVDSETDGIDSYDISFSCIVSGIEFDETNCGLDVDNDGLHVTVNGSTTLDVNPCETVSVCHTIYTQNIFGGEWLDTLSMNLGSCYTNITNMVPTSPGPNGFYDGGGEWTGVYDGPTNSIEWGFNYSGPQLWGDGFGGIGYNCRAYTFCFDAEISSTCTNNNLTVQLKIEDDGVNGAIAGASPGFDFATSNNFTISNPPPTITCPVNVVVNNDVGNCSAVVNGLTPVRNDNCPNPFVTYSIVGATTGSGVNDASGTTFNIGITTVQYMVTDSLGLQDSCSFTVTVVDNENPTITCPTNVITSNDLGVCTAVVNGIAPIAFGDNCVIDSVNFVLTGATTGSGLNNASGIAFNVGLTTVTYTVTDTSGNVTSCNFSINITDNVNPTISCPGNVNISNDVGSCSAVVNGIIPTPADNCAIDSVNYVLTGATIGSGLSDASGTIFNVGVTNVNYTVTDFFGNSSNCTFTVTVIDNEAPAISCPPNVNTNNDVGICGAIVNGIAPTIVSDNCVIDSVNYTLTGVTIGSGLNDVSGSVFNVGITTVIYTITDVSGNTSSCNFTVTVTDNEPPTFICPANTNEFVDINCDFSIPDYTGVFGLADNCTPNLSIIVSQSPLIGTIISGHSTTQNITIYVTDIVGNIDSCIFIVTLVDTIKPTITCTGDTTEFFGNNCSFTLPNYSPISVGDNCTAAVAIVVTQLPTPGVIIFSDTLITLTANDGNGNIDTCTFMVLLSDTIDPIISCPNDTIVNNDLGLCDATITIGIPLNFDNCGIGSLLNDYNGGGDASDIYPVGLTTVVWTVIDNSLNITTCSFDVTVIDAEEPSITCVNDTIINTDNNSCNAVFNYTISAFDNCFFTISQISGLPSGAAFPQGITTNTFVATDPSGLADTCSFLVTVIDNQNPTIVCPNDTILCNTNVTIPLPNLGDNCLVGNVVNDFNLTNNASGIYPVGITLINWTAFDASGNSNSCVMTVQVDLKPSIADAGEDQHILINQNTNLEALSPFVGVGLWSLISGNGVVDDNLNSLSMVSDLAIGDNIFRWTIVNGTCPDSFDEVNVIVGGLNVPNGFSPNGDGNNDLFVIPGIERMNNEVVIFNRWGVELYKTNNYQNDWNGDSNGGNTLPDDTYFYIIRLIDFSEEYSGYVVIKR